MANINIKNLIGNGDGMANDVIFKEDKFEWFKSSEDGYIYTRNIETGRNTRYNAEGQNGKRIGDVEYITKFTEAMDRHNASEAVSEDDRYHEEPEDVEQVFEADPAPKAEEKAPRAKKTNRPKRASKDIAYSYVERDEDGTITTEITLTAKQVDFIQHLSDSCFWENGLDSALWTDVLCDEIGGQFEGKPMTVGAMISTICEKGLGVRVKDRINGRKATAFTLTKLGKKIAAELGLN